MRRLSGLVPPYLISTEPNAGRGLSYANAGPKFAALGLSFTTVSGCTGPGSTDDAVAAAQEAVGTTGKPRHAMFQLITVDGHDRRLVFADGTTRTDALTYRPAWAAACLTRPHRDAAAAAQGTANNAATAATAAADIANANTGRLDAFPAGTGGVDQCGTELTTHECADGGGGATRPITRCSERHGAGNGGRCETVSTRTKPAAHRDGGRCADGGGGGTGCHHKPDLDAHEAHATHERRQLLLADAAADAAQSAID